MNMTALITLVSNGYKYVFPYEELAVIFFIAFLILILIKSGADRISSVFIIVLAAGSLAYTGILTTPIIWGLILIGGGFLLYKTITMIFGENT